MYTHLHATRPPSPQPPIASHFINKQPRVSQRIRCCRSTSWVERLYITTHTHTCTVKNEIRDTCTEARQQECTRALINNGPNVEWNGTREKGWKIVHAHARARARARAHSTTCRGMYVPGENLRNRERGRRRCQHGREDSRPLGSRTGASHWHRRSEFQRSRHSYSPHPPAC